MCKFNLIEAISSSIDPLTGCDDQKLPPACWDYPVLPPFVEEPAPPVEEALLGPVDGIPADLQDLFLQSPSMSVPSLPCDDANYLLDALLSDPASPPLLSDPASPPLFNSLSPLSPLSPLSGDDSTSPGACCDVSELLPPRMEMQDDLLPPSAALSPDLLPPPSVLSPDLLPPQVVAEGWMAPLSPAVVHSDDSRAADWLQSTSPSDASSVSPPTKRRASRPRPYDKPRRQQITDEERRQRKKEQNKSAATRYRQKKKEEQVLTNTDQDSLELRNVQLKARVNTLSRELSYLRQLMQRVIRYKRRT